MLVLNRKCTEEVIIRHRSGDVLRVKWLKVRSNSIVQLGFDGDPAEFVIDRAEVDRLKHPPEGPCQ